MNKLFFGDNVAVLTRHVPPASVDLIYLDPPFNSKARYNVLFRSLRDDVRSAQAGAFLDFWSWGQEAEEAYHFILTEVGGATASMIQSLRAALRESDMMAYLVMMAVRLATLRDALKPTGSLYLHCDPTASHYLKVLMDSIFGPEFFVNELIWKRYGAHNNTGQGAKHFGRVHDTILFYSRSKRHTWHQLYTPQTQDYIDSRFTYVDAAGRRYTDTPLTGPGGAAKGNPVYEWNGHTRAWRVSKETMQRMHDGGELHYTKTGYVRGKRYLDEVEGVPVQSVWNDIAPLAGRMPERIGYPTQKPVALLERIIKASSNPGDVVLDPFCGCGTAVHAAQALGRQWIGIDISIHAIHVIEHRLAEAFGGPAVPKAEGIPADFETAAQLAKDNPFQFQWWANYLIGVHYLKEVKKGADRGVDGELFFPNGPGRPYGRLITSVKAGKNVAPAMVRELRGVVERENAEMGLFICLEPPTREMEREAVVAGFAPVVHGRIPRIQIMSIADWFSARRPQLPPREHIAAAVLAGAQQPKSRRRVDPNQRELLFEHEGGRAADKFVRHLNPAMVDISSATPKAG